MAIKIGKAITRALGIPDKVAPYVLMSNPVGLTIVAADAAIATVGQKISGSAPTPQQQNARADFGPYNVPSGGVPPAYSVYFQEPLNRGDYSQWDYSMGSSTPFSIPLASTPLGTSPANSLATSWEDFLASSLLNS